MSKRSSESEKNSHKVWLDYDLPKEIWGTIANHLDLKSIVDSLSLISKKFHQIAFQSIKTIHSTAYIPRKIIHQLNHVTTLTIRGEKLIEDDDIKHMTSLRNLILCQSKVGIHITSTLLENMTNLKSICINGYIKIRQEDLFNIPNLIELALINVHGFTDEGVSKFTQLTSITMMTRGLTGSCLLNMHRLSALALTYNDEINDDIVSKLTNLTTLDLFLNSCVTDRGLYTLTNMKSLNLIHNQLITVVGISGMTNLETIYISPHSKITPICIELKLPKCVIKKCG